MIEKVTHGSLGERWKRSIPPRHLRSRVGVLRNATLMGWSGTTSAVSATAPALYPARLRPVYHGAARTIEAQAAGGPSAAGDAER